MCWGDSCSISVLNVTDLGVSWYGIVLVSAVLWSAVGIFGLFWVGSVVRVDTNVVLLEEWNWELIILSTVFSLLTLFVIEYIECLFNGGFVGLSIESFAVGKMLGDDEDKKLFINVDEGKCLWYSLFVVFVLSSGFPDVYWFPCCWLLLLLWFDWFVIFINEYMP